MLGFWVCFVTLPGARHHDVSGGLFGWYGDGSHSLARLDAAHSEALFTIVYRQSVGADPALGSTHVEGVSLSACYLMGQLLA